MLKRSLVYNIFWRSELHNPEPIRSSPVRPATILCSAIGLLGKTASGTQLAGVCAPNISNMPGYRRRSSKYAIATIFSAAAKIVVARPLRRTSLKHLSDLGRRFPTNRVTTAFKVGERRLLQLGDHYAQFFPADDAIISHSQLAIRSQKKQYKFSKNSLHSFNAKIDCAVTASSKKYNRLNSFAHHF